MGMADILQKVNRKMKSICPRCIHNDVCLAIANQPCFECNHFMEVVRCKDCRYYNPDGEYCGFWGEVRHPEHFCGEGDKEVNE